MPLEMFDGQPSASQYLLIARQQYMLYANVQGAVYRIAAINITMQASTNTLANRNGADWLNVSLDL